jgi:hypothetical protein
MIAGTILAYSIAFNQPPAARRSARQARTSRIATDMRISGRLLFVLAVCMNCCADAAELPQKIFELTIVHGTVPPPERLLKVEKGDALKLRITSDTPGELHLHGYRLAAKLAPGQPAELAFTAYATGRYPLEWHAAGEASSTSAHRRGPPLATLEVQPK